MSSGRVAVISHRSLRSLDAGLFIPWVSIGGIDSHARLAEEGGVASGQLSLFERSEKSLISYTMESVTILRAQVIFPYRSGVARDVSVNTFHFEYDGVILDATMAADLSIPLSRFYSVPDSGGRAVGGYLSSYIEKTGFNRARIQWYNLDDPLPRPIIYTQFVDPVIPLATTTDSYPFEVAFTISFRTVPYAAGVAQASQRGRIFLGPLASLSGSVAELPVPTDDIIDDCNFASQRLVTEAAAKGAVWSIYSRKLNEAYPVLAGWADNEFDTMRSRQLKATSRNPWP